jgi:hypothetical protein
VAQLSKPAPVKTVGKKTTLTAEDPGNQMNTGVQETPASTTTKEQRTLAQVNKDAPTETINANNRPPQLGPNATDAELAQNYRQKADYQRDLAKKYPDNPEYLANAKQYDEWAARRQTLANQG